MKRIHAVCIVLLFLAIVVAPTQAIHEQDVKDAANQQLSGLSNFNLLNLHQGLYYMAPHSPYKLLRDWTNKSFPQTTLMFFGSGIGIFHFLNLSIAFVSAPDQYPSRIDVYCDGAYYTTLYPEFWGPISVRFYQLYYHEKGFHSLKFVANDNTTKFLDVQVGWNGFIDNILPHLAPHI